MSGAIDAGLDPTERQFWRRRGEGECRGDDQNGEDAECDDSHTR
jgi:hypothetical protein